MRIAVAIGAVLFSSSPADACIPAFTRAIVGAPEFEPRDAVTITNESVAVTCDERFACTITSTFDMAVSAPARVTVTGYETPQLGVRVGGSPLAVAADTIDDFGARRASVELAPSDRTLTVHARAQLPEYIDGCFTDGVIARHPYLASKPAGHERVLQIDTTATPEIHHPSSWDLVVDTRAATKRDPATTRLWFDVPRRLVSHGGPLLMIGAASGPGSTFRLRGAWEAAAFRSWLVLAIAGDTDFADVWNVALTAEPTSRAWVLPLSFGLGGGVVLGHGERVGGRGQLSVALGAVRTMVSVDVLAPNGDAGTDVTVVGLVGVGI